jgi:ribosomal protein L29
MPLAADAKEELVGDRFQGKMVTIGPSNPIVKRPVRKPTEYVKTALRELRQGGLVQLVSDGIPKRTYRW